ncbi:hypothetical protein F5884DRAFT_113004 [Xylogone sp. PMI_703]|nr:hypothetical protein F5884DRAFT_113004 [Xylogone sp. PMI_703]
MLSLRSRTVALSKSIVTGRRGRGVQDQVVLAAAKVDQPGIQLRAAQQADGNESSPDDGRIELGDGDVLAAQGQDRSTGMQSETSEFSGSTQTGTAQVATDSASDSQRAELVSDAVAELPDGLDQSATDSHLRGSFLSVTEDAANTALDTQSTESLDCAAGMETGSLAYCKATEVRPDVDSEVLADVTRAGDVNTKTSELLSDQASLPLKPVFQPINAVAHSQADSVGESRVMTGEGSDSPIVISDDETERRQNKKSPRSGHCKVPKRSFDQYVETENLWMNSTLKDIDDFLRTTRKSIKRLQDMEKQLIASQKFIGDCGVKEQEITKRLEKSK